MSPAVTGQIAPEAGVAKEKLPTILNAAEETVSAPLSVITSLIRTLAAAETVAGINQSLVPAEPSVLPKSIQLSTPLAEYSNFTLATEPSICQRICLVSPTPQREAESGASR